ncbi:LOW QUALITY PROTEIN: uncharacterized protein [Macrobrachium rosenbergii]|uniref:LOW QUALITY PROTEIN: uncharacterized protein n=1 Tax=Macrobrachium rosenbergii TaxID=79674 RepID=UPI0034D72607
MDGSSSSRRALVIRDDGEARVVPLADVSVIGEEASGEDKNSAVIVWQTSEQIDSLKSSSVGLQPYGKPDDEDSHNPEISLESVDSLETFIGLSANQEDFTDQFGGTVITIADADVSPSLNSGPLEKVKLNILPKERWTPILTDVQVHEDMVVNGDLMEPTHIIRAHANSNSFPVGHPSCQSSPHVFSSKIHVSRYSERRTADGDEGGGGSGDIGQRIWKANLSDISKKGVDYTHLVKDWTRRFPSSSKGLYEPFERVEATLHKDVISELGIGTDNGIFLSLHQQGATRGVRVTETGPNQVVVSGSLVELLASRDLILKEIDRIRGGSDESVLCGYEEPNTEVTSKHGTREVGVMCELIPSPPMTRYASSLGLDRSARRYHSVLSRPLSPEPRPQRRKSRRHLLSSPKEKNCEKIKVLQEFSESCKVPMQNHCQIIVKSESGPLERVPNIGCTDNVSERLPSESVEMILDTMKMEPGSSSPALLVTVGPSSGLGPAVTCGPDDTRSITLPVTQADATHEASSFQEELTLRLADERMTRRLKSSSNGTERNKENIEIEIGHIKSKDLEGQCKDAGMDSKSSEIVCETKIDPALRKSKAVKGSTPKEIKYKFSCNICSYKSMRENHFIKHMKLHDKGLALYRCNECSFVSIRASHLRRHKMSHAMQVLNCHLCAYTCDDKKLLTKYVRVKHQIPKQQRPATNDSESQEIFECHDCEYKTSWQYSFQRHRRTHAPSKVVDIHACPQCSYKTMRREHFLRHIKNVHQNHRPFLCDICGKAFKRQDALKQHHVTHYQNVGNNSSGQVGPYGFICPICQKVCRSSAYLKEHMATHSEERAFLCEVCGASFKTRSVQRNHVQTIHRRPRSFTCSACEKKFNTKFALRRHMKQHDLSLLDTEGPAEVTSSSRLCSLQQNLDTLTHSNSEGVPSSISDGPVTVTATAPGLSSSQAPPSAYQITIDGQPAFILPHIGPPHTFVSEEGETAIIGDTSTVLVEGNPDTKAELTEVDSHADQHRRISVPVGSNTVHIVEQDPLNRTSGEMLLSSDQYESNRASNISANSNVSYVTSEHTNSTLVYLTTNF